MRPYKGHNPEGIPEGKTRDAVLAVHDYLKQLNQVLGTPSAGQTGDVTIYQTSVKTALPDGLYQDIEVAQKGKNLFVRQAGKRKFVSTLTELLAAISEMPNGGVIYLAPGTYTLGETLTITTPNLKLIGAGVGLTNINLLDYDSDIIRVRHGGFVLEGVTVYHGTQLGNGYGAVGTGRGIVIDMQVTNADYVSGISLQNMEVLNTGSWCIYDTGFYSYDDISYNNGFNGATFTGGNTAEHPFPIWGYASTVGTVHTIALCGTTLDSKTITAGGTFTNVRVGQYVYGDGIPHGTYVTHKISNSEIKVNNRCTATGTVTLEFKHYTNCRITVQLTLIDVTLAFPNSGGCLFVGYAGTTLRCSGLKTNSYSYGSIAGHNDTTSTTATTMGSVHVYGHTKGVFDNNCIFQSPGAQAGTEPVPHLDTDATMLSFDAAYDIHLYAPYFEVLSTYCEDGVNWYGGYPATVDDYGYRQYWFISLSNSTDIVFDNPYFGAQTRKKDPADAATYGANNYYDGYPARLVRSRGGSSGSAFTMRGGRVSHWRLWYSSSPPFPAPVAPFASGDFYPNDENGNSTSNPWDRDDFLLEGGNDGTIIFPVVIEDVAIWNYNTGAKREASVPPTLGIWNRVAFRVNTSGRGLKFGRFAEVQTLGTPTMDNADYRLGFSQPFKGGNLIYCLGSSPDVGSIQREGFWATSSRDSNFRQIPFIRNSPGIWSPIYAGDLWMKLGNISGSVYTSADFRWYDSGAWKDPLVKQLATTVGDILYCSSIADPTIPTWVRRGIGSTGDVLTVAGGVPTWAAPTTAFVDSTFRVQDNGDATRQLAFECSGITSGNTRTVTVPDVSGNLLLDTSSPTISSVWRFDGSLGLGSHTPTIYISPGGTALNGYGFALDDGSGFIAEIQSAGMTADRYWILPDGSGTFLISNVVALLAGSTSSYFKTSSSTIGARFEDNTTSSKRLRFVLSGAVGDNSITITNTAKRNYGLGDLAGFIPVVGDDPPAVASGAIGKVDSVGLTGAVASTNLSNTPPAGLYRVDVYAVCTTASGSGAPTLDVNIAWSDVFGATNRNCTAEPGATAFPLSLAATGRTSASMLIQVNSGNIAYSTTINAAAGTPQYALYIRVTFLG